DAGIAGAAIGLALLSHGGVVFTVIALGIVLLATRTLPPGRALLSGILMLTMLLLPWVIYQKVYDPPGDRLLKWHLAGFTEYTSRSFPQLLAEAYTQPEASTIIHNKIENFKTLLGPPPRRGLWVAGKGLLWRSLAAWYKGAVFFYFFQTLGLLNLGLFTLLPAPLFSKESRIRNVLSPVLRLLVLATVSLVVWCLLLYIPGSTLIHQGSLADVVLFFIALVISLMAVSRRLTYVLLGLHSFVLFPLFALTDTPPVSPTTTAGAHRTDGGMMMLSLLGLAGLVSFG